MELLLLIWREWLQIARDLPITCRNQNQPFVLRTLLELKQALHRAAIVRIATEAVAGFCWIGDQAAASEVGGETAKGCAMSEQLLSV